VPQGPVKPTGGRMSVWEGFGSTSEKEQREDTVRITINLRDQKPLGRGASPQSVRKTQTHRPGGKWTIMGAKQTVEKQPPPQGPPTAPLLGGPHADLGSG